MIFTCSYCDTEFSECHSDSDCRDILINDIYEKIIKIDEKFKDSNLPDGVDKDLIDKLIVKV